MLKSLFKSRKFTIAFIVMLIVIILLTLALISFLPKKGDDGSDIQHSQIATIPQESENTEETGSTEAVKLSAPGVVTAEHSHLLPLMNEEIEESGTLKINDEMETKGGIVFHKKAEFDSVEAEGNTVNYRGTFPVIGKQFVMYQDLPTIMYHTAEDYYVTSNPDYVTYEAQSREINTDPSKITTYGYNDSHGLILTVYAEDGNHLIFSLETFDGAEKKDVLKYVIAKYDAFGTANFEYVFDGTTKNGQLNFKKEDGKVQGVTITFADKVLLGTQETKELSFTK